jgi:chaperonin cofactor prefoldin
MARTRTRQFKVDSRPLYAVVGAGDFVVERARTAATDVQARLTEVQARLGDVQARLADIDLQPGSLRDQARTRVTSRVDEFQAEAKTLPTRAQKLVDEYTKEFDKAVAELNDTYEDLATRGRTVVTWIRRQQATQDAKAAAETTKAKAKTTRTQTAKSARSTASSAKSTAGTAKRGAKATRTSASNAASAAAKATSDGASKVGD